MPQNVLFVLFDYSGAPLIGASPLVTLHRSSNGASLPLPTVTELGGGFYEFVADTTVYGPSAYLIDCRASSSVRYLSGSVGDLVAFAMYDSAGEPDDSRAPSFSVYTDGNPVSLPQPVVVNLTGGLYGFWAQPYAGQVIRYVVGDASDRFWGTLGTPLPLGASSTTSLGELFKQLSYGELHDLKAASDGSGTILSAKRNQVVHHINEGLLKLHLRFSLMMSTQDVTVPVGTTPYLVAFDAAAVQVVSLVTPGGLSVPFMTNPSPDRIFVHNRRLSFPPTECEYKLQVLWQNRHPRISPVQSDADLQQPIYLQPELWSALRAYVAAEMYGVMNTNDARAQSMKYRSKYEADCLEAEGEGGTPQEMLGDEKFGRRGFV